MFLFIQLTLTCFLAGFFTSAFADISIDEDAIAFAKQQQEKISATLSNFKSDVQIIQKQTMNQAIQNDAKQFAEQAIQKTHACPVAEKTTGALATSQGVNLDVLLKRYANQLPSLNAASQRPQQSLLIFVSFSMPEQSLKQWLNQAKSAGGILMIRGLVNHSFKETIARVSQLLDGKMGGMQLDPILFKRYNIKQVPAVVITQGNMYDVVYGDIPLFTALENIAQQGDCQSVAQRFIDANKAI